VDLTLGIVDILSLFVSSRFDYDLSITDNTVPGTEPFFQTVAGAVASGLTARRSHNLVRLTWWCASHVRRSRATLSLPRR
jgi:hypothetical protein